MTSRETTEPEETLPQRLRSYAISCDPGELDEDILFQAADDIERLYWDLATLLEENEQLRGILAHFVEQEEKGLLLPLGVFEEASQILGRT